MNRRDFLVGFLGTAGVAISGSVPLSLLEPGFEVSCETWFRDTGDVFSDYYTNLILYGIGMLEYIETYPYVRSVPPQEIYAIPTTQLKGLL